MMRAGSWSRAGSLGVGRIGAAALRLADGRVLVCGGCAEDEPNVSAFDSAETWDPATDRWTSAGALNVARWEHAACATRDGAWVFGGLADTSRTAAVFGVERYTDGRWERCDELLPWPTHGVLPLDEGRVLLVGPHSELVLWDPDGPQAIPAPPMRAEGAAALTLGDDSLVLVGGYRARKSAEPDAARWDPRTRAWSLGPRMIRPRYGPTATLLRGGSVLVVGGYDYDRNCTVAEVELLDPQTRSFSAVGKLTQARTSHTATLLPDGRVLIVGGHRRDEKGRGGPLADVVLFDPETHALTSGPPLSSPRRGHHAIALRDGSVMIVGGGTTSGPMREVERWGA